MHAVESTFKAEYAKGVLRDLNNWKRNRESKKLPTESLADAIDIISEYRDIMLDMPHTEEESHG